MYLSLRTLLSPYKVLCTINIFYYYRDVPGTGLADGEVSDGEKREGPCPMELIF